MKNRLIALLLAFAMCFSLCSCGVDFDDDIDDEKDSEISELDDYVESIYVYLIITMNKCSADDYEIFRMDYDHDGAVDWIVHCAVSDSMNDFWMLFDGGCVDASPKAFFNTSMQGELSLYKSQSGNLYVESAITGNRYRGSSEYFCYNGEFQEHCLNYSYEYTTEELSEDDKVSSYAVNGESCSEKEFDEYLSKLHLTKLVGGETSFDDYLDVPDEYLDEVIDRVCDFSFVDSCTKKDVDDDGRDDLVFSTKLSHDSATDTYQPVGFDCIGYENGCYEFGMPLLYFAWQENYYVLSSDSSSASIDTVTEDKAQSLLSGEKKDEDKAEMGKDKERDPYIVAISTNDGHTVGLYSDGTVVATGDNNSGECDVGAWRNVVAISTGWFHTVGLRSDGTVVATGRNEEGQCDVDAWTDIVAVSAGGLYTVGLHSDGTVVATGNNISGECDVGGWTDIVAISADFSTTVGLRSDGTVVATGSTYNVDNWTDIIAIAVGGSCIAGLKSNGTVVVAEYEYGFVRRSEVKDWRNIVAISAGEYHIAGLRSDGTVVRTGMGAHYENDVDEWTNIVSIYTYGWCLNAITVGLRSDGTVVTTKFPENTQVSASYYEYGQCADEWTDIIAISAKKGHAIGLRSDGTVVATGINDYGQCNVSGW